MRGARWQKCACLACSLLTGDASLTAMSGVAHLVSARARHQAYFSKLEVTVVADELRLQAGNMVGHMVSVEHPLSSPSPWLRALARSRATLLGRT